jgi:hypothetical protein
MMRRQSGCAVSCKGQWVNRGVSNVLVYYYGVRYLLTLLTVAIELCIVSSMEFEVFHVSAVRLFVLAVDMTLSVFAAEVPCRGCCVCVVRVAFFFFVVPMCAVIRLLRFIINYCVIKSYIIIPTNSKLSLLI